MILGEVNGIIYKEIEANDFGKVLELFMEVIEDEPLSKSEGGYMTDDSGSYPPRSMTDFMAGVLSKGSSLMAVEKDTNKVVGIRTQYIVKRGHKEVKLSLEKLLQLYPRPWAHLLNVCNKHWSAQKFFEENPEVERVLCFFFLAVKSDYRDRSIGTQLIKLAINHSARKPESPCQAVQAFASNPATRTIFEKFGFRLLSEHEDFEDVDTGKQVFPGQTVTVHLLKL